MDWSSIQFVQCVQYTVMVLPYFPPYPTQTLTLRPQSGNYGPSYLQAILYCIVPGDTGALLAADTGVILLGSLAGLTQGIFVEAIWGLNGEGSALTDAACVNSTTLPTSYLISPTSHVHIFYNSSHSHKWLHHLDEDYSRQARDDHALSAINELRFLMDPFGLWLPYSLPD